MKKLLVLLICVPLIFSSCENKKNTSLDINVDDLKGPCELLDAMVSITDDLIKLGEENNWEPLLEDSDELKIVIELMKKMNDIYNLGVPMRSEFDSCDNSHEAEAIDGEKGEKIEDWIRTFQEHISLD